MLMLKEAAAPFADDELALPLLLRSGSEAAARRAAPPGRRRLRTVWISDVHLGTRSSKATALLEFLDSVAIDHLYLVGDIIDEWKLRRSFYWPGTHAAVLDRFAELARNGTRVIYVPGNHDETLRRHDGSNLRGLECRDELVHETSDGRRLLVLHGDRFDRYSRSDQWIVRVGELAYGAVLGLNNAYNGVGRLFGVRYRSLSLVLKQKVKEAVSFISDFEASLLDAARDRRVDGVVCGHVHRAQMREVDGVLYTNDGDWVESCTALVEDLQGRLELVQWRAGRMQPVDTSGRYAAAVAC